MEEEVVENENTSSEAIAETAAPENVAETSSPSPQHNKQKSRYIFNKAIKSNINIQF